MDKILTLDEFAVWMWKNSGLKWYKPKPYKLTKPKILKQAIRETRMTESGVPYIVKLEAAKKTTVPDTNRITDLIVDYLNYYKGWSARRFSSEGRYRPDIKKFIRGVNNGMEDVNCIMAGGRTLAIELKATKSDKQRPDQVKRQSEVERSGGVYLLLRWTTFEEFQEIIRGVER